MPSHQASLSRPSPNHSSNPDVHEHHRTRQAGEEADSHSAAPRSRAYIRTADRRTCCHECVGKDTHTHTQCPVSQPTSAPLAQRQRAAMTCIVALVCRCMCVSLLVYGAVCRGVHKTFRRACLRKLTRLKSVPMKETAQVLPTPAHYIR